MFSMFIELMNIKVRSGVIRPSPSAIDRPGIAKTGSIRRLDGLGRVRGRLM